MLPGEVIGVFVCVCHAVTDDDVAAAVASGAPDAAAVAQRTGASTGCGTCHDTVCDLVDRIRGTQPSFLAS